MTEPDYSPGQTVENGRTICGAKKRDGQPCGASPARGHIRCRRHGGATPQAKAKAKARVVEAAARQILGTIDPDAPYEHPVETLMTLIRHKHAEVVWLRAVVRDLTEGELTWGLTEHRTGIGPEGPVDIETRKPEQNIWWKLLREAENQLASWTAAAAKAGVEEREVSLREDQALKISGAINQILAALHLTTDQQKLVPDVVPAALRAIEGGKP